MDMITNEAKSQAEELIQKALKSKEIMIAIDMNNQIKYSVRIGDIGNRQNDLSRRDAFSLVHALETRIKSLGNKPETNWPSSIGMAHCYHNFKRQNFLN
jgi:hypothetical protein